ncbi:MAG: hypothetical protein ACYSX1_09815 [Planctomycetota bacterium]|jgi:hypothetical protein
MADEFMIRPSDIPREELEKLGEFIVNYSTVLIYENQPFASGTLVKCGARFGILTAHHVPYNTTKPFNFRPNSSDRLGLAIKKDEHAFWIAMQYLHPYPVGVPVNEESGPDMVFLDILDNDKLGWIKAYGSFWEISLEDGASMIEMCSCDSDGLWAIAGLPQSMTQEEQPRGGFDRLLGLPLQVYFGGVERRFEAGGFDYVDLVADYDLKDPMPDSFAGLSGGGLWKIPVSSTRKDLNAFRCGEPVLSGLQFCQTALENNRRRLGCHGPKTLYSALPRVLKDG